MIALTTDSPLFSSLFRLPEVAEQFSGRQFVRYMLDVEAALAAVQGQLGVIPVEAAEQIVSGAAELTVDLEQVRVGMEKAGVPVIELVRQLRTHVGGEAADYVHWGATTQDIMDTACVLQLREVITILEVSLADLTQNFASLADRHRYTLMAGRTHSQQAVPIPFGLKVAGWAAPLLRDQQRLDELKPRLLTVQFGGAAGTLSALGNQGTAVQSALAAKLNLNAPLIPWHTQRDRLVELANWLSLVTGSLAKMAQDIILMAQSEVREVQESSDQSRGGSSTMPQKHNPVISEQIIAAARTNATLLANMHQAMIQEHERATHGWQMEWLTLPQMMNLTAVSLHKAHFLSENIVINEKQMRNNVAASHGLMLAEAITFVLAPSYMSRQAAKQLVHESCQTALAQNRHLVDVVQTQVDTSLDWPALRDEANCFGAADTFINNVLTHITEP